MVDQTVRKSAKQKLIEELRANFLDAKQKDKTRRQLKEEADRFYDGDQWTEQEIEVLKKRNQPVVTINRIKSKIDSITGKELKMGVDTKAFPRGRRDELAPSPFNELFRYIEYQSEFDLQENQAFKDVLVGGRGWYKTEIRWDAFDPEIVTERIDDADVYVDPYCKRDDLSDAKYIHETVWQDLEDTKRLYPRFAKRLEQLMFEREGGDYTGEGKSVEYNPDQYDQAGDSTPSGWYPDFVDKKRRRIRLVSTWYRTPYTVKILLHDKGAEDVSEHSEKDIATMQEAHPFSEVFSDIRYRLNYAVYCGDILLERKEDIKPGDPHALFDHVLIPAYELRQKAKRGQHVGLVRQMLDPQKETNKRRSKTLHLLNTNKMLFEKGAFENPKLARDEWAKPDAWMEYDPQFNVNPQTNTELAQSQFMLMQESKAEIDNTGIKGEPEGVSAATSGRDFKLRHEASMDMIAELFAKLRVARKRVAQLWIYYIQNYWSPEKILSIVENPELVDVVLNTDTKFDIIVEESPETLNLQSEEFDKITKLAGLGIPIPPDFIIESSSLPPDVKGRVLQRLQAQAQQAAKAAGAQQGLQ